jgi:hypothetical protein
MESPSPARFACAALRAIDGCPARTLTHDSRSSMIEDSLRIARERGGRAHDEHGLTGY